MTLRRPSWRHHAVGLALCAGYVVFLAATNDATGIPRDESFYFDAGRNAAQWWIGLADPEVESFSRKKILYLTMTESPR